MNGQSLLSYSAFHKTKQIDYFNFQHFVSMHSSYRSYQPQQKMCKVRFKVQKYIWYGNECHGSVTYSKCQLLITYHSNLLRIYTCFICSWLTAILEGIFTQVLLGFTKKKKRKRVATMAKSQHNVIVLFSLYDTKLS